MSESIDGTVYYTAAEAARLWGVPKRTAQRYIKESPDRLEGGERRLLVSEDALRPIDKATAQAIVWEILELKNFPQRSADLSAAGIGKGQHPPRFSAT